MVPIKAPASGILACLAHRQCGGHFSLRVALSCFSALPLSRSEWRAQLSNKSPKLDLCHAVHPQGSVMSNALGLHLLFYFFLCFTQICKKCLASLKMKVAMIRMTTYKKGRPLRVPKSCVD